jgi:hypothetical protein
MLHRLPRLSSPAQGGGGGSTALMLGNMFVALRNSLKSQGVGPVLILPFFTGGAFKGSVQSPDLRTKIVGVALAP